jgi:hypothetical protein
METLERFDQNRRVIEDFTANSLTAISTEFGRLLYVASLLDLGTGRYLHEGLAALYPDAEVQQGLAHCHEELFCRILETSLELQEWDLRATIGGLEGNFWEIIHRWRAVEFYRLLAPIGLPDYLRELFASNVRTLLAIISQERGE